MRTPDLAAEVSAETILTGVETYDQIKHNIDLFKTVKLSRSLIEDIEDNFHSISENISNPTLWNI